MQKQAKSTKDLLCKYYNFLRRNKHSSYGIGIIKKFVQLKEVGDNMELKYLCSKANFTFHYGKLTD